MNNQFPTDKQFAQLMRNSKLEMPFSDFEDKVMARVHQQAVAKNAISIYKKLALVFFIIGAGAGLLVTWLLSIPVATIGGVQSTTVLLIVRTAYVLLVLTQLDTIISLFRSPLGVNLYEKPNHLL
jgi:hypothetical protein